MFQIIHDNMINLAILPKMKILKSKKTIPVPMEMKPAERWSIQENPQNQIESLQTQSTHKREKRNKLIV